MSAPHASTRLTLTAQIIIGMLLGMAAGALFGPRFAAFGVLGKLLIQLIKAIAVPLVFFAIFEAVISTVLSWRHARRLLVVVVINSLCAAGIGLTLSNAIQPGHHMALRKDAAHVPADPNLKKFAEKTIDPLEVLAGHLPENLLDPFTSGDIIGVVLIALLFGSAARRIRHQPQLAESAQRLEQGAVFGLRLFEQALGWLIKLTPLAVFGVTAKIVGEHGFEPFKGLALYVVLGLGGMALHIAIVYQLWVTLFARISLKEFWRRAKEPVGYAVGVNSSLATLPLTLKALESLGVSKAASRLGACVATNFNNDGIILYEAMAVLFVAQAYGIDLSAAQQCTTVLLCMIAASGVAGIPEAGVVSLSLVLTTVGLPVEVLPLLLTVDWVVARARSVTNVLSDMTVSIVIDAWDRTTEGAPARAPAAD